MDQKGDPAGHEHRVQGLLRGHESQIADRDLQRSLVRPVFSAQFHVLNGRIGRRSHVFKLGQHRPKRSMVFKLVGVGCIVADIEQVADVVEQSRRRSLCFRRNVVVSRQHDGIGEIGEPSESRAVRHAFGLHPDMLGMLLVQGFLVDGLRAFEHAMHIRDELRIVEDVRIVVAEAARQASPGGDAHGIAGFSTLNGADVVAGGCRQGILGHVLRLADTEAEDCGVQCRTGFHGRSSMSNAEKLPCSQARPTRQNHDSTPTGSLRSS